MQCSKVLALVSVVALLSACGAQQDFSSQPKTAVRSAASTIVNPPVAEPAVQMAAPPTSGAAQCVAYSGQSCTVDVDKVEYAAGCPQDYICAEYVGIWYGSATGCDRTGEVCSTLNSSYPTGNYQSCTRPAFEKQHVSYKGTRCTYVGNGTSDPFGAKADGQCRAAVNYPIPNTYAQVVPTTGCMERPVHSTVQKTGRYGCDGVCRL